MALPVSKPTRADVFLIVSVFILSIAFIFFHSMTNTENPTGFIITVDGKLYASYNFDDLIDGEIIELDTQYGYNKFIYENKSIKCIETNCNDKTELKSGTIKKTNQILVCLPHRLTVQITGNTKIDAISY